MSKDKKKRIPISSKKQSQLSKPGTDTEKARKVVHDVFHALNRRIQLFVNLPAASLDRLALSKAVSEIGEQK